RHFLFRPGQRSVTAQKKQPTSDCSVPPMNSYRRRCAAESQPRVQQSACGEVPGRHHQQWRNTFYGIPNREVRGSPDQVKGDEGHHQAYGRDTLLAATNRVLAAIRLVNGGATHVQDWAMS